MNDGNVISLTWTAQKITKLIKSFKAKNTTLNRDACLTELMLQGILYLLYKIHDDNFSLSLEELIEFIGMEKLCVLASEDDSTLSNEDKRFAALLLNSIPEFNRSVAPEKQSNSFKGVFSSAHALILSESAEDMTSTFEQILKKNSNEKC